MDGDMWRWVVEDDVLQQNPNSVPWFLDRIALLGANPEVGWRIWSPMVDCDRGTNEKRGK
jgi:hypothetical protein